MPNVSAVLKEEMTRVARKELRVQLVPVRKATIATRKANGAARREIAELKRIILTLRRELAAIRRTRGAAAAASSDGKQTRRFSAKGMARHRKRSGLSAAAYGKLYGVTAQSIYNWESGSSRPSERHVHTLVSLRSLGKRALQQRLQNGSK